MNDRVLVAKMVAYIESGLINPITAEDMALKSGYSINRFRQKFFNVTGDTPSGYLRKRRLTEAAKEIMNDGRLVEIAHKYGYSSQDNFTTSFRSYFGVTPSELSRIESRYKRFIRNMREAYTIMEIVNLNQPPLNTTLMGCIKGASDFFDNDYSAAMLFGLTGHAFLINIHKELCPSGPYVWKKERFSELLKNLGIEMTTVYQVGKETTGGERRTIEEELKAHLDQGNLCMLDFLEHQLFAGYDENGFLMLQPWNGRASSEVPAITFGTWNECFEKMGWAHLTVLSHTSPQKNLTDAAKDALAYGLELYSAPEKHHVDGYQIGYGAYDWWVEAVKSGLGESHGHWWNGTVWSECRMFAAEFFRELAELLQSNRIAGACRNLAVVYSNMAEVLSKVKEKELEASKKLKLLHAAQEMEREAETGIGTLLEVM